MPVTTETMRVEVEMRAREALTQFEKLDSQFRETAGNNKMLYRELWTQHKKYASDVEKENKKRAADEKWLTRELGKEGEARKRTVQKEAKEERWLANQLTKEMQQRVKDERWLTRELEKEQKQRERDAERAAKEAERANQKTSRFGGMGGGGLSDKIFAAYAAVDAARTLATLADRGLRAADSLAAVHRGLEHVYGSSELASARFKELNELAKLPGLDPEPLARFDSIFKNLGSTAEQNNVLFTGLAKSVTTFGGDVFSVSSALYQLSQGFAKNKIDAQDFKSISEQTGGTFLKTAGEVLNFTGGIEGMREAFKASGETLQDFLMPVFVQLNKEFAGAPVDSYTNAIDNLGVAFKNLTAEMFSNASGVGKFLNHITGFLEKEKELWNDMRTGGAAIKAVGDESELSAAKLSILQKDFGRVSTELKNVQEKYDALKEKGIHPATASMEQLQRRIDFLSERKQVLSANVDKAKDAFVDLKPTADDVDTTFRILAPHTQDVDTRFLGLKERGMVLKDAISELPPELTKINELLPATSAHSDKLKQYFDSLKTSVVDTTEEQRVLNLIFGEGINQLNDYAPALNLTVTEANNVDPAIRRMATAARDMNVEVIKSKDQLRDELVPSLEDTYDALANRVNPELDNLRLRAGDASTELDRLDDFLGNVYEDLDKITNETDVPGVIFDISDSITNDLAGALRDIATGGDLSIIFEDLGSNLGRSLADNLIAELTQEHIGPRINDALGSVFSGLESSGVIATAGTLAGPVAVFAAAIAGFAAAGEAWVDHFGGETQQKPIDDYMRLIAGASGLTLPGLQKNFGEWTGGALDFSHLVTATTGPTDEGAAALASSRYNLYQQLKGRTSATPQSEADRIAFESGMMTPEEEAAYLAGYPDEPTGEAAGAQSQGTASSGSSSQPASTGSQPPEIRDVHRFTGGESTHLRNLNGVIKEKRTNLMQLGEDADFTTVLDTYGEYTTAIQDLYDAKFEFIKQSENIKGDAESAALTAALQEFNSLTFRANQDLGRAISKTGYTLVNTFDATTGILQRNQIQRGVVHGDEHTGVVKAEAPKMQTTGGTVRSQTPAESHRFTSGESGTLSTINNEVRRQREDFRNTRNADFTEILNKYGTYTAAIQKLYNEKIAFIASANLTPGASSTAQQLALDEFYSLTFIANEDLADVLAENGSQLVNEFSTTTGIIARNQVVRGVVHGDEHTGVVKADTPKMKTVTSASNTPTKPQTRLGKDTTEGQLALAIEKAQYALGGAVDEQDFEDKQGQLIDAIDAYFEHELNRINQLELSDDELALLRETNAFEQLKAVDRAILKENHFATERIKNEKAVADAKIAEAKRVKAEIESLYAPTTSGGSTQSDAQASFGGLSGIASGGAYQGKKGLTMGDVLGEGVGFQNYKDSVKEWQKDPLGKFIAQGDIDADITAGEAFAGATSANYIQSLLNAIQAYKNTGEESLKSLIRYYANLARQFVDDTDIVNIPNLLFSSGLGDLLDQREFHFPQADRVAALAGSQTARAISANPTPTQMENARDFSENFSQGMLTEMRRNAETTQPPVVNVNVTVMVDSDEIATPRFAEKISDQLSTNIQNGVNRR